MKIKSLLIGMLACSAMVACTNEDPIDNGSENPANGKNDAYVSVTFAMPETGGSRATSDGGYDVGNTTEQTIVVDKSIFLFYDANDNYVTFGNLVGQVTTNEDAQGNHSEHSTLNTLDVNAKKGEAFIALSASDNEINKITQVLTVVNYSKVGGIADLKNKPLSYALSMTTNETSDPSNAGFLMTTSVYFDQEGELVQTTAITEDNIAETQTAALADPVKIYIERASAKVGLTATETDKIFEVDPEDKEDSNDENKEADILFNGTLTPVSVKILGYVVNNTNTSTNLVKQVGSNWNTEGSIPFAGWNQYDNYRSYWAMGTEYGYDGFLTESTSTTTGEGETATTTTTPNQHRLTVKSFNDAMTNAFTNMYCYEQTVEEANVVADRSTPVYYPNVTTVLIAGQILVGEATSGVTLYKYSGVFYDAANYQKLIKSRLTEYKKADGASYQEDDWTVTLESNVANPFNVTVSATGATVNENDYSDIVAGTEVYTNGYCYYQIPIEHLQSGDDPTSDTEEENPIRYGVVRNHWYQLKVSGVKHIGEPVYNPGNPIPEIPEKDAAHYLAATIHVLSWHVVEQDVTLE